MELKTWRYLGDLLPVFREDFFSLHNLIMHYYPEWLNYILISASSLSSCISLLLPSFFFLPKNLFIHAQKQPVTSNFLQINHTILRGYLCRFLTWVLLSQILNCSILKLHHYLLIRSTEKGTYIHHKQPLHTTIWVNKHHFPPLASVRTKHHTCLFPARAKPVLLLNTSQKNISVPSMNDCLSMKWLKIHLTLKCFYERSCMKIGKQWQFRKTNKQTKPAPLPPANPTNPKQNPKQGKSLTVLGSAEVFNTNITLPCPAANC